MSTPNPTVPPLVGDPHTRAEVLGPMCDCLMDVVENLHGMEGTQWAAEPYTEDEREMSIRAIRAVIQMMKTYGRTRDPFVSRNGEEA